MTLGEAKAQVLRLLDEYGEGADPELEARMAGLIDLAQKRLAGIQKTVVSVEVDCTMGECRLPEDALGFCRLHCNGRPVRSPRRRGERILLPPGTHSAVLEYFLLPPKVDENSADELVLGITESAAACLPFLVAGELLCADMVQDGSSLLSIYRQMVSELDTSLPGGEGRVQNNIFGGRR